MKNCLLTQRFAFPLAKHDGLKSSFKKLKFERGFKTLCFAIVKVFSYKVFNRNRN